MGKQVKWIKRHRLPVIKLVSHKDAMNSLGNRVNMIVRTLRGA